MKWKKIPWTDGAYSVSNTGRIRSNDRKGADGRELEGKELKVVKQEHGYYMVDLMVDGKRKHCQIHRLVAEMFCKDYSDDMDVNHKDGNKAHNYASNLECIPHDENIQHAYDNGLIKKSSIIINNDINRHIKRLIPFN